MQIAIVADDLTGAADAAGVFAERSLSTVVATGDATTFDAAVISLNTESRDCPADQAVARIEQAIRGLTGLAQLPAKPLIYKKMDSALRGHPGEELAAVIRATGVERAVVAPALPSEHRTTRNGVQYCGDLPLHLTAIGSGRVTSHVAELLGQALTSLPITTMTPLRLNGGAAIPERGVAVVDATTDYDLDLIASSALAAGVRLLSGSAGLSRALARQHATVSNTSATEPPILRDGPVLLVVGSRHQASVQQVEYAAEHGVAVFRPDEHQLGEFDGSMGSVIEAAERALAQGRHVIVTTAGLPELACSSTSIADRLTMVVDSLTVQKCIAGLFLAGGDVAAAACARLAASAIWLNGEVRPAIPIGWFADGRLQGIPVVTKAGSFGPSETLIECIARLSNSPSVRLVS